MAHLHGSATLVAGIFLIVAGHASVAAQSAGLDGAVHRGTCDRLADPVSDPTPFFFGVGERRGNSQAVPAASSFATIPVPFDTLLTDDHAATASDPGGDVIACGEIAGTRTDDGALMIGLRAEAESAITGVAYLAPSDDASQTEVTLMVAGEPLAAMANAQAQEAAAYADDLVRITQSMTESLRAFVTLMRDPRLGEDDWMRDVGAQLAIWDSNHEEALALNPPPALAETHALLVEALRLYSEAGNDVALGLDTLDAGPLNQAASTVAEANESFVQVVADVDRILQGRSE